MNGTLQYTKLCSRTLKYKPCGVILGQTGAGKTTLANKLCGTSHRAGAAKGSVTQELFRNDVNCGSNPFSLIDTPGTDSSTEPYKHAYLLRQALTATDTNTIFILIKYNNRFDKMVDNYFELVRLVFRYVRKVAIMISHMDISENPEPEFKEMCEMFAEERPGDVFNILFFSDKSPESDITDFMYSCLSNMPAEKIVISVEEFLLKFNICTLRNQLKVEFNEYQGTIGAIVKEYGDLIGTTEGKSVEEKDEILHMMIVEFKNETEILYQRFTETHGGSMGQLDYYVFAIKMQKENVRVCDEFVGKVTQLMSYNLFDSKDIRNLIKQCPHCKLIWYKIEGCDGTTTCGNRVSARYAYDVSPTAVFKYIMRRINGKRTVEKSGVRDIMDVGIIPSETPESGTGVGCGVQIVWSSLPKLDDKLILELYKVKTIAEAVELIKDGEFKDARATYERNIDKDFKS